MSKTIAIYDTTLRDGAQAEGVNFSVADKIMIAQRLDEFGVAYIEGGWPHTSRVRDSEFFQQAKKITFKNAKLAAFGSTAHPKNKPEDDPNLIGLVESGAPVITIFGKSWDFHVTDALQIELEQNLAIVESSIAFLKSQGREVFFDAEHFFDGYASNPEYALRVCQAAVQGGADGIVLCETNGGALPVNVFTATKAVVDAVDDSVVIGIHAHNDGGLGVANSLEAVRAGALHVQGVINGFGERCGNANLCTIIPNLQLKMGLNCIDSNNIKMLTEVSHYIFEIANMPFDKRMPFVGNSAFAHKGGIHVSAVMKNAGLYEHIDPALVGNRQRVLVSDQSGKSNIEYKISELGITFPEGADKNLPKEIVRQIYELENQGYEFEGAEGSMELLIQRAGGTYSPIFELNHWRCIIEKRNGKVVSEAAVKLTVNDTEEYVVAEGNGPVNALDKALRKALLQFYPEIKEMELTDYKVRVLGSSCGTGANVRVLIESRKKETLWGTVGVSENLIEASWQALVESIEYMLLKKL